jgi:hypothetical protein
MLFISLIYLGWYLFATITSDNTLLFRMMNMFGPDSVTYVMSFFALGLVLLSLGNIKWIPSQIRNKEIGPLLLHAYGVVIGVVCLVTFVSIIL